MHMGFVAVPPPSPTRSPRPETRRRRRRRRRDDDNNVFWVVVVDATRHGRRCRRCGRGLGRRRPFRTRVTAGAPSGAPEAR